MKWTPITARHYFLILKSIRSELSVYSSCTDIDFVMTEWGLKNTELPIIKAIDQLMCDEIDLEWNYRYYKMSIPRRDQQSERNWLRFLSMSK